MNSATAPNSTSAGDATQTAWEAAYQRFETPDQEIRKFQKRLRQMGALDWPRDAEIVEIFCGRGNGLKALTGLGFSRLEGVDLSPALLARYSGPARCVVADCRRLSFPDASRDVLIVQGGLHHLPNLPDDLTQTLDEVVRVLRPGGRFMVVEPWRTPFLTAVHAISFFPPFRRAWGKLDAFATMTELERDTYERWLARPTQLLPLIESRFEVERRIISFGKLRFLGRKRP